MEECFVIEGEIQITHVFEAEISFLDIPEAEIQLTHVFEAEVCV